MRRVLAVDYGRRRIGLAVSDPLGITAQGLDTLEVRSRNLAAAEVSRVAREREAGEIVVGLPLNMDGTAGPMAEEVRAFAAELEERTGLPVALRDERLTSAAAHRTAREMEVRLRGRKGAIDRMSAVLILQGYLERRHA
jgi:putative Holliday junction resolvase